ncbi:MAG: ABC transporter ATP-binding protein [Desulfosalsimonas sp.]
MLEVKNLTFGYRPGIPVLRDIGLSVPAGSLCSLFGPNGCGKTTLFRCCLSFLKPSQGTVHINKRSIRRMSVRKIARHVAYVPQEHRTPFPYLVKDLVLMGRTPHTGPILGVSRTDREKAWEAIELMELADIAHRPFNELSGGQRQLVLMARAIAQETKLMLLDEPTSALDFSNQIRIWRLIRHISRKGITVLACSHNPNHVAWFCDQVIVMNEGTVLAQGRPEITIEENILDRIYPGTCSVRSVDGRRVVVPRII